MYELNDSPYFIYSNLIKEYCLPLFNLTPVKGFTFCRTYEDKTAFLLTTEYQFNLECIQHEKRISKLEMLRTPMHTLEGYFLNSPPLMENPLLFMKLLRKNLDMGIVLLLSESMRITVITFILSGTNIKLI